MMIGKNLMENKNDLSGACRVLQEEKLRLSKGIVHEGSYEDELIMAIDCVCNFCIDMVKAILGKGD